MVNRHQPQPDPQQRSQQTPTDHLVSEVGDAVRRLGLQVNSYVAAVARQTGHHAADLHAVAVVRRAAEHGAPMGAGDLGRTLGLSPAAVSAMLHRMERAGHVQRTRAGDDGRRVLLVPTDRTFEDSSHLFAPMTDGFRDVLDDYSPEQLAVVTEVLDRLRDATADAEHEIGHRERGLGPA